MAFLWGEETEQKPKGLGNSLHRLSIFLVEQWLYIALEKGKG